jgi:transketolase
LSMKATRVAYGEWLAEAGKVHPELVVVDADLSASTMTNMFQKAFPDRFFDVGSAEQNLVSFSAGLALGGKRVFASSFAIFETGRAWDQIRNVVAHDELNV